MIRDNLPLALEDTKLFNIVNSSVFADEKSLFCEEITSQNKISEYISFILSSYEEEEKEGKEIKDPTTLLNEAGYDFYVCDTVADVEKFKKYYKSGEELCTFNNIEWRLSNYYIFWIISKNIKSITHKGNDRKRQDDYGISCCSIQISKKNNIISIKNRYNHKVSNCDATFGNNLDNIIDGLSKSFNKFFDFKIKKNNNFEMDGRLVRNGKIIKYNYEINAIYYGINKYIKNWELIILNKDNQILIDYYLIDLKLNKIIKIDEMLQDDFFNLKFSKIVVMKNKNNNFENEKDEKDVLKIFI